MAEEKPLQCPREGVEGVQKWCSKMDAQTYNFIILLIFLMVGCWADA